MNQHLLSSILSIIVPATLKIKDKFISDIESKKPLITTHYSFPLINQKIEENTDTEIFKLTIGLYKIHLEKDGIDSWGFDIYINNHQGSYFADSCLAYRATLDKVNEEELIACLTDALIKSIVLTEIIDAPYWKAIDVLDDGNQAFFNKKEEESKIQTKIADYVKNYIGDFTERTPEEQSKEMKRLFLNNISMAVRRFFEKALDDIRFRNSTGSIDELTLSSALWTQQDKTKPENNGLVEVVYLKIKMTETKGKWNIASQVEVRETQLIEENGVTFFDEQSKSIGTYLIDVTEGININQLDEAFFDKIQNDFFNKLSMTAAKDYQSKRITNANIIRSMGIENILDLK